MKGQRWLCALILFPTLCAAGASSPIAERGRLVASCATAAPGPATAASQQCCKVCTKGKACGNTCIARDKKCHKGAGCACNG